MRWRGKAFLATLCTSVVKVERPDSLWVSIGRVCRVLGQAGGQWRWLQVQDHMWTAVVRQWFNGFNDVDSMSLLLHLVNSLPINQTPPTSYNESGKSKLLLGHLDMKPHGRNVFSPIESKILQVMKKQSVATVHSGWGVTIVYSMCARFCPGVASSSLYVYPQYCGLRRSAFGHCMGWKYNIHYVWFLLFLKVFGDFVLVCHCWQFWGVCKVQETWITFKFSLFMTINFLFQWKYFGIFFLFQIMFEPQCFLIFHIGFKAWLLIALIQFVDQLHIYPYIWA